VAKQEASKEKIGILHPGQMGVVVAKTIRNSGHDVYWASAGRSTESRGRASDAGLTDAGSVERLCEICAAIVSVCPPEFAEALAREVAGYSFSGLYLDLNAISPECVHRIQGLVTGAGGVFLDGSIIGVPASARGQTWVYVAGQSAARAAAYFCGGPLEFEVLSDEAGQASALKMCFAAHSKGTAALQATVLAAAQSLGVQDALQRQWARSGPNFERLASSIRQAAPKAWRFIGEMNEIAKTFESAGVSKAFPVAACEIYEKLRELKGAAPPDLPGILERLRA
jgi:3-hydroxyisobutyrate dehydrogenase-like beta-hydroxyacid dehydrogenase